MRQRWLPREARRGPWRGLPAEGSQQGESWQARQGAAVLVVALRRLLPRQGAGALELRNASWGGHVLLFLPPGWHLQFAEWLIGTALGARPSWGPP